MSGGALRVGVALGIPIRIHFTFLLLLVWFGTVSAGTGEGFVNGIVIMLLLFGCVVLHELGHAAMARRYGVETREIVLYPIGGVARLDRIPSGKAELLIALAGPAVNAVLGALLFVAILVRDGGPWALAERLSTASWNVVDRLLFMNLALLFFNLIPAFPMDGGRVLRALLSFAFGQEKATVFASRVGQVLAVGMAIWAVVSPVNPMLLLVAMLVFFGAGQEAAFERGRSAMAGLAARDAMVTKFETIAPQDSIGRVADLLIASHQQDFPVVDAWGRIAGVLPRGGLLAALAAGGRDTAVLEVMDREPRVVPPELPLEQVFRYLQQGRAAPAVLVAGPQGLLGMITLENVGELIAVSQSLRR